MDLEIKIPIKCTCGHVFVYGVPKVADLTIDCTLVRIIEEDEDIYCPKCNSRIGFFIDIEVVEHSKGGENGTSS